MNLKMGVVEQLVRRHCVLSTRNFGADAVRFFFSNYFKHGTDVDFETTSLRCRLEVADCFCQSVNHYLLQIQNRNNKIKIEIKIKIKNKLTRLI